MELARNVMERGATAPTAARPMLKSAGKITLPAVRELLFARLFYTYAKRAPTGDDPMSFNMNRRKERRREQEIEDEQEYEKLRRATETWRSIYGNVTGLLEHLSIDPYELKACLDEMPPDRI